MSHSIISAVYGKAWNIIRRGRVSAPSNEAGVVQKVQIQKGPFENSTHIAMQDYGFASAPLPGCDVVMVCPAGGEQSNGVIVAKNDPNHRPKNMAGGETQIYDNATQYVYLKSGQKVVINAKSEIDFLINGTMVGSFNSTGLSVMGTITATGIITGSDVLTTGGISLENHLTTGVSTGSGTSGPPVG